MQKLLWSIGTLVVLVGAAAAHPHEFVGVVGDVVVICDDPASGVPGLGGVCIPGGHIVPGPDGSFTLTPVDDLFQPTSAFYCQDLNNDNICGGAGEPSTTYCGSRTINQGEMDPNQPIFWFVDGPVFGNPLLSPCGTVSMGSHGRLLHTP